MQFYFLFFLFIHALSGWLFIMIGVYLCLTGILFDRLHQHYLMPINLLIFVLSVLMTYIYITDQSYKAIDIYIYIL